MKPVLFLLIVVLISSMSCGTIMNGTTQEIGFYSNPRDAKVTINGRIAGHTPCTQVLKRNNSYLVKVELDGYEPYEIILSKDISGWAWGNIFPGLLIGFAVDAISGGLYKLTPDEVFARMRKKEHETSNGDGLFYLEVSPGMKEKWEKVGDLVRK